MTLNKKRTLLLVGLPIGIFVLAFAIIKLAQGYKPDWAHKTLKPTGLLVATSVPDGAQLWINGKLKSATNTTLNLPPGQYKVKIKKDGFFTWEKTLLLKKELVTKADADLFTTYPDLKVLTFTGAGDPLLSPDGQKVVFRVATASASKRGIWVLDLSSRPLGFNRVPRQILRNPPASVNQNASLSRDFSLAQYEWAPDSKQLLVRLNRQAFLVDSGRLNPTNSLVNVSPQVPAIKRRWAKEEKIRQDAKISKLPKKLLKVLGDAADEIQFSPDETKILYIATASATIPEKIIPPLAAASSQKESRQIEPGKAYVYDLKEDKNFYIAPSEQRRLVWFPTSRHIFTVQNEKISIVEYDGTNRVDVYTGPFEDSFAFPFPSGDKILILTSIGKKTPTNLYAVSLR